MEPLELFRDPLVVIGLAIAIFAGRVFYMAKRLKSAARNPTLADQRALEQAKQSLDAHKQSLRAARGTMTGNIEGARDTLRYYRKPLDRAREGTTKAISGALRQEAFEEAKQLYRTSRPKPKSKRPRRTRETESDF